MSHSSKASKGKNESVSDSSKGKRESKVEPPLCNFPLKRTGGFCRRRAGSCWQHPTVTNVWWYDPDESDLTDHTADSEVEYEPESKEWEQYRKKRLGKLPVADLYADETQPHQPPPAVPRKYPKLGARRQVDPDKLPDPNARRGPSPPRRDKRILFAKSYHAQ